MRDLGPAARLDNTRACSIGSRISRTANFVEATGAQRIRSRQIDQPHGEAGRRYRQTLLALASDTGVVRDLLTAAGQRVEERGLAAVGISDKRNPGRQRELAYQQSDSTRIEAASRRRSATVPSFTRTIRFGRRLAVGVLRTRSASVSPGLKTFGFIDLTVGSPRTLRWREGDSNPRSPVYGELGATQVRKKEPRLPRGWRVHLLPGGTRQQRGETLPNRRQRAVSIRRLRAGQAAGAASPRHSAKVAGWLTWQTLAKRFAIRISAARRGADQRETDSNPRSPHLRGARRTRARATRPTAPMIGFVTRDEC
jgi:hypothetical protein